MIPNDYAITSVSPEHESISWSDVSRDQGTSIRDARRCRSGAFKVYSADISHRNSITPY